MKLDYQNPTVLIFHIQQDVITGSNPLAENDFSDPFTLKTFVGGKEE